MKKLSLLVGILLLGVGCQPSVPASFPPPESSTPSTVQESVTSNGSNITALEQKVSELQGVIAKSSDRGSWARQIDMLWQRTYPYGPSYESMTRALLMSVIPNNGDPNVLDRYKVFGSVKNPAKKNLVAVLIGNIPGVSPNGDCCAHPRGFFIVDGNRMTKQYYLSAHPFFDPTTEYPYVENLHWKGNTLLFDEIRDEACADTGGPCERVISKQFLVGEQNGFMLDNVIQKDGKVYQELYAGEATVTGTVFDMSDGAAGHWTEQYCMQVDPSYKYLIPRDSGERKNYDFCFGALAAKNLGLSLSRSNAPDSSCDVANVLQLKIKNYVHVQWDYVNQALGIRGDEIDQSTAFADEPTLVSAKVLKKNVCLDSLNLPSVVRAKKVVMMKYTNAKYGYSFYYPKTWTLRELSDGVALYHVGSDAGTIHIAHSTVAEDDNARTGKVKYVFDPQQKMWTQSGVEENNQNGTEVSLQGSVNPSFRTFSGFDVLPGETGKSDIVALGDTSFLIVTTYDDPRSVDPFVKGITRADQALTDEQMNSIMGDILKAEMPNQGE